MDRGRRAGLLGAADMGHHAEGAELVATGLRSHKSLEGGWPHLRIAVRIVAFEALRDRLAAAAGAVEADLQPRATAGEHLVDEAGHAMELPRADDEIDPRRPLADEFLILLGHAAEHAHDQSGPLLLFEADTAAILHLLDPATLFPYKPPQMQRVFTAFEAMLRRRAITPALAVP